jgi:hypothetical protein
MSWTIGDGPQPVAALGSHDRYCYDLRRGDEHRTTFVEITHAAVASAETRPSPLGDHIHDRGEALVAATRDRLEPPLRIVIHSMGWSIHPRQGVYVPGDWVFVREQDGWREAQFRQAGEPADAVVVERPEIDDGSLADVAWVAVAGEARLRAAVYTDIRAERPAAERD